VDSQADISAWRDVPLPAPTGRGAKIARFLASLGTSPFGSEAAATRRRWSSAQLLGIALVVLCAAAASAQEIPGLSESPAEESAPAPDPTAPQEVQSRLAAVAAEIRTTEEAIETADAPRVGHLNAVRQRLQEIAAILKQEAALTAAPEARTEDIDASFAKRPSPFALHELYEAQWVREESSRDQDRLVDASREALEAAKERLAESQKDRRRARQELEAAGPAEQASAAMALELRDLESRAAQEKVHLRKLETRAAVRDRDIDPGPDVLAEQIGSMRAALSRGEGDSKAGFAALAEREGALRRQREATERRLATAELRLTAGQKRFSDQVQPGADLLAEVESLGARRDSIRRELALLDAQIERVGEQRETWRRWDALLRGQPAREELEAWESNVSEQIEALTRIELQRAGRAADLQRRLETIERRISATAEGSRLRGALVEELETLRRLDAELRAEAEDLAADRRLSERLLAEIHGRTGHIDPLEYAARGAQAARDVWGYEITAVDDSPITVGSLVLACFLFGVGLWAARRGSNVVARVSQERLKLDAGAAHALQTLSFYALLLAFALLALRAIHFPLTAFTVLGGALAIGVGFGSQNVMNNFISGLIIMLERPVRARDVVEVDGNHGTIENIGARSTQIRSTDGRHIVVPNSFFLESNVVNWTLSDELVRAKVSVGVIYGSPTRLVEELIQRVVDEEERVLKRPEPIIVFEEFGDNSLNFDVYFWVKARSPMQMRQVQSQLRFRIDDLFREHDLVIAFPQRDVHLDSVAPIEVRVLNGGVRPESDPDPDRAQRE
jgi:small-conductance mechanosensitive channel